MDNTGTVQIKFYEDCSELPIWNFHKVKKDFRWLVKCDEIDEIDRLPIDTPQLWSKIFNEYCDISDNMESQEHLRQLAELDELQRKYLWCNLLLMQLYSGLTKDEEQEYFKELSAWGFAFNQGDLMKEMKRAEVWLKSIKTRINFLKADTDGYEKRQTHSERLEKQQVKLERITGRNEIDLKRTSVAKWLEIIKDAETTAKQKQKKKAA